MKKKKRNYVNNKDLYDHLVKYHESYLKSQEAGLPKPEVPRYIAECIIKIAQKLATKRNFSQYSYVEEMILDAIENVIRYIHNFNPEKSNKPFSYITRMAHNAFVRRIEYEQLQQYTLLGNSQSFLITDQLNPGQIMAPQTELYGNLQDFMSNFEKKMERRTNKKKEKRKVKLSEQETDTKKDDEFWS